MHTTELLATTTDKSAGNVGKRCQLPMRITWDLFGFTHSPFKQSREWIPDRPDSSWTTEDAGSAAENDLTSWWWWRLWLLMIIPKGDMYVEHYLSPKTDLFGLQVWEELRMMMADRIGLPAASACGYMNGPSGALSQTLKDASSLVMIWAWTMVSNAELKCKLISRVGRLWFKSQKMLLKVWRKAISVELCDRQADWTGLKTGQFTTRREKQVSVACILICWSDWKLVYSQKEEKGPVMVSVKGVDSSRPENVRKDTGSDHLAALAIHI